MARPLLIDPDLRHVLAGFIEDAATPTPEDEHDPSSEELAEDLVQHLAHEGYQVVRS